MELNARSYHRLFETARDGILVLDAGSGKILDANPYLGEVLGYTREDLLDKNLWDLGAFKNIGASRVLFRKLQEKEYVRYHELPLECRDGRLIQAEFVSNVYVDEGEKRIQCRIRDITDRMDQEKHLTDGIEQKEELLRELQHRTKNSFTMILGLMILRCEVTSSPETKLALEELTMRVRSISDLYSLLYETDSFFNVPLQVYCSKVIASMVTFSTNVEIRKTIADRPVSAKQAAIIGMILVELLTNAIKYAFPDGRAGTIIVDLQQSDGTFVLTIGDDGVGLPSGFDLGSVKSMGLHLVQMMVKQLKGTYTMETDRGTKIRMSWAA